MYREYICTAYLTFKINRLYRIHLNTLLKLPMIDLVDWAPRCSSHLVATDICIRIVETCGTVSY